jgi:lipopolysaccharide transport system ATP-binding protein
MGQPIISVSGLGKRYLIQARREHYLSLREQLARAITEQGRRRRQAVEFWALRDISFDVHAGEVIGILGRNGAGKSTLLKILAQITPPTQGRVRLGARVASLLEVGTGFHPELTGRENIHLSGAILGMTRKHIRARFDEIVDFAEIEQFLDTPVKRYSSGMYVRLAFAVAAHLDSEILLVDEVLAVGDAQFQAKCLGKMGDAARSGRTIIFVSHNMGAITSLTQRCILLSRGKVVLVADARTAVAAYLQQAGSFDNASYSADASATQPRITHIEVCTSAPGITQVHGESMDIAVEITTPTAIDGCRLAVHASDEQLRRTFYVWLYDSEQPICRTSGRHRLVCHIPRIHLYQGSYTLDVQLAERFGGRHFDVVNGVCRFQVLHDQAREGGFEPGEAVYVEDCRWEVTSVEADRLRRRLTPEGDLVDAAEFGRADGFYGTN